MPRRRRGRSPLLFLLHRLEAPVLLTLLGLAVAGSLLLAWSPRQHRPLGRADPVTAEDRDGDGLVDAREDVLLARFAPHALLSPTESARPASIAWVRGRTELADSGRRQLLGASVAAPFDEKTRAGSKDPADWTVYGHAYPRADGGVELQYWMFFAYNDGPFLFDHDSDWEHVSVSLDSEGRPQAFWLAAHDLNAPGRRLSWAEVSLDGNHPRFFVAAGTHAAYPSAEVAPFWERLAECGPLPPGDAALPKSFVAELWAAGERSPLVNVGERGRPRRVGADDDFFLNYRGLYGAAVLPAGVASPYGPPFQRGFCIHAREGSCP